jgi:rRNA maturation protein Rpf1
MLITTSRRPSHRTRLLGRELARVLPNAKYMPRGDKSIRKLASLASSQNHKLITIITNRVHQPQELRFLDTTAGWRWLEERIELRKVELQRDLGRKVKLANVKIAANDQAKAQNLARFLSELWDLPFTEKPSGNVALAKDDEGLRLQFHEDPKAKPVGPILHIARFR